MWNPGTQTGAGLTGFPGFSTALLGKAGAPEQAANAHGGRGAGQRSGFECRRHLTACSGHGLFNPRGLPCPEGAVEASSASLGTVAGGWDPPHISLPLLTSIPVL